MSKQCACGLCNRGRSFQEHLKLIPGSEREYFEAMYEQLLQAEFDLDYYRAVMNGEWPGAVGTLEYALAKAKTVQTMRDNKS